MTGMIRYFVRAALMATVGLVVSCGCGVEDGCGPLSPPAYREFPSFIEEKAHDVATLAHTVNLYVGLGEDAAFSDLRKRAAELDKGHHDSSTREYRIELVARILGGSSGKVLRPRSQEDIGFGGHGIRLSTWPHFPMVHSGDSFFVMMKGRIIAGLEPPLVDYLDYCRLEGRFRRSPLPVPTREQALRDLDGLKASPRWRSLDGDLEAVLAMEFMRWQIPPARGRN